MFVWNEYEINFSAEKATQETFKMTEQIFNEKTLNESITDDMFDNITTCQLTDIDDMLIMN